MTETGKNKTSGRIGISPHVLESAVEGIADLCDSGKCLLFLPRSNTVRIVAKLTDLQDRLENVSDLDAVLREIRLLLTIILRFGEEKAPEVARSYLEVDQDADEKTADSRQEEQALVDEKLAIIKEHLLTTLLKQRAKRLRTSCSPTLEEVDVEQLASRRDELKEEEIGQAFLRLRLRYVVEEATFFPFFFGMMDVPIPTKSFEFECDASDIDLLIARLVAAKEVLAKASEHAGGVRLE